MFLKRLRAVAGFYWVKVGASHSVMGSTAREMPGPLRLGWNSANSIFTEHITRSFQHDFIKMWIIMCQSGVIIMNMYYSLCWPLYSAIRWRADWQRSWNKLFAIFMKRPHNWMEFICPSWLRGKLFPTFKLLTYGILHSICAEVACVTAFHAYSCLHMACQNEACLISVASPMQNWAKVLHYWAYQT